MYVSVYNTCVHTYVFLVKSKTVLCFWLLASGSTLRALKLETLHLPLTKQRSCAD